jgi:Leucine-rich repeat (LRR) protein
LDLFNNKLKTVSKWFNKKANTTKWLFLSYNSIESIDAFSFDDLLE